MILKKGILEEIEKVLLWMEDKELYEELCTVMKYEEKKEWQKKKKRS